MGLMLLIPLGRFALASFPKWRTYLAGFTEAGFTIVLAKIVSAPLDRVQILLQVRNELVKLNRLPANCYTSVIDSIRRIYKTEGALGFWKGSAVAVLSSIPTTVLNFAFNDLFRRIFTSSVEKDGYTKWFVGNLLAGGLAGAATLFFTHPTELVRTRLIAETEEGGKQFSGFFNAYYKTLRAGGIGGLYQGFFVAIVGGFVHRALYFGLYDSLKVLLPEDTRKSAIGAFLLGWGVTVLADLASYPFDTIKRRMMVTSGESVKYESTFGAFNEIIKKEGVESLWRGASVSVTRTIAGGILLTGYERMPHSNKA